MSEFVEDFVKLDTLVGLGRRVETAVGVADDFYGARFDATGRFFAGEVAHLEGFF